MKFVGMNWVWPMAPAQEPRNLSREIWPSCRSRSATRNSLRKYGCRYLACASVASERTTSHLSLSAPYDVSIPQIARMIQRSTWYFFSTASRVARHSFSLRRPVAARSGEAIAFT